MDTGTILWIIGIIFTLAVGVVGYVLTAKYATNRRTSNVVIKNNFLKQGDVVGGDKNVNIPKDERK